MPEEAWHAARLIPTSGISGAREQERRAASAALAVISAVKELGRTLLGGLGAPSGNVETYIEVPFKLGDRTLRPDGLIRVSRGSKSWTALVEVKTGKNDLATEQVEAYLDIAREQRFDALITISNQIPASVDQHPTHVDKRKLRSVSLHHWSWSYLLATAVLQKDHRGVSDPDQAWILGELIRYLEHPRSGALDFDDMGAGWITVRDSVAAGTLRSTDTAIQDVVMRFDALMRYCSLHLGRRLGTDVVQHFSRRQRAEPSLRSQALSESLVQSGTLTGDISIPNMVGPIHVTADLRARKITCQVEIDAPKAGRSTTRVNWLVRQLKDAPASLRIEAFTRGQRGAGTAELLGAVRDSPNLLILDPKKEIRRFQVAVIHPMGTKRGRGKGAFIDSVLDALDSSYEDMVRRLKSWSEPPARLRTLDEPPQEVPAALVSTALSSQDGTEPARPVLAETPTDSDNVTTSNPTPPSIVPSSTSMWSNFR